jgi:hypothetical protein
MVSNSDLCSLELACSADPQRRTALAGLRHLAKQKAAESVKRLRATILANFSCRSLPHGSDFLRSHPCQHGWLNKRSKNPLRRRGFSRELQRNNLDNLPHQMRRGPLVWTVCDCRHCGIVRLSGSQSALLAKAPYLSSVLSEQSPNFLNGDKDMLWYTHS